jgi:hypothetical protein
MSFFQFGNTSIAVSQSLWIYFILAVPLTLITLGGMAYRLGSRRKLNGKTDEEDPPGRKWGKKESK